MTVTANLVRLAGAVIVGIVVSLINPPASPSVAINLVRQPEPTASRLDSPRPFARSGGIALTPPTKKVVKYTYHESMFSPALRLRPRGRPQLIGNSNFRAPKPRPGPRYIVLPSRGRGTGAATATDIVLRRNAPVTSPVDGTVVAVTDYQLYCAKPDTRIILRPRNRPDLRVVIFHVDRVKLQRGDRVKAGDTRLGRVRFFPNSRAQYDSFVSGNHPHVHIEVQQGRVFPLPGCR
ncbi:MAG: hypothetical protein CMH41_01155 [Micrococcales bacterium]|nr:hypothetical protein [Micrococcales bacterium]